MTMSNFQSLISKIMTDETFRTNLLSNPAETLRAEGVEPSAEILESLAGTDVDSIISLASNFEEDKAAH